LYMNLLTGMDSRWQCDCAMCEAKIM
jgi:hypothetical protein